MKTRSIIISALSAAVVLSSCAGTDEISPSQYSAPSVSTSPAGVTGSTVEITLNASASKNNFRECGFYYGTDQTLSDARKLPVTSGSSFSSSFVPDGYGKTYYWQAYLTNNGAEVRSSVSSVKSLTFPEYVKVSSPTTEITPQGVVVVGATMEIAEGLILTDRGVCYSKTANPTIASPTVSSAPAAGVIAARIEGLTIGSTYHLRCYACQGEEVTYGSEVTVVPCKTPTVTTAAVTDITSSTASCGGEVTSDGGAEVTARGVVWSTSPNPTVDLQTKTTDGTGTGSFTSSLTNLNPGTKYYVRAYATSSAGTGYGAEKTFTTDITIPSVSTSEVTGIGSFIATCGGNVTSDGGASVTARGVVWSTSPNPTVSLSTKTTDGTGTGSFTSSLTDLQKKTMYYVRSYAINSEGISYGEQRTFTTSEFDSVDLGLSVRWASSNIGAETYTDYGDYYAWGETSTKSDYYWDTYKWCKGSETTMTKYCTSSSYGTVDNKTVLEFSDDVAHVKWGGSWRIPTADEWQELYNNCTWTLTTISGVKGYKVTSKKPGYTSRWIFLPAAGCRNGTYLRNVGSSGYYWSSSLYSGSSSGACSCWFDSDDVGPRVYYSRYYGHAVRPVCD